MNSFAYSIINANPLINIPVNYQSYRAFIQNKKKKIGDTYSNKTESATRAQYMDTVRRCRSLFNKIKNKIEITLSKVFSWLPLLLINGPLIDSKHLAKF